MLDLMKGIRSLLEARMAVKPGEQVLVIADDEGGAMWVGQLIMNVVNSMGAEAVLSVISTRERIGPREPPPSVAAAMKSANTIFRVTDKNPLVHSNARRDATAAGARYFIVHPSPVDELKQSVSVAELGLIKERTESLAQRLGKAKVARVTSPSGTNITMNLTGREGEAHHPLGSVVANLSNYAEAAIAPVEGSAEGIVAVEAITQWGFRFKQPLRLTVKAGKVVDIAGSMQDAERLRKIVATDDNSSNIAELGIGTSHIIASPMQNFRNYAAGIGTAHIGIGRNNDIGGTTWSRIHQDALMEQVTVELDGHCVLREGGLQI